MMYVINYDIMFGRFLGKFGDQKEPLVELTFKQDTILLERNGNQLIH